MLKFHPHVIMVSVGVLVLFISLLGYQAGGTSGFLLSTFLLMILAGFFIGVAWPIYPWQLAIFGCLPSCVFLLWRFFTVATAPEESLNDSLYIFLPVISMASTYFGGYAGRWYSLKRKKKKAD